MLGHLTLITRVINDAFKSECVIGSICGEQRQASEVSLELPRSDPFSITHYLTVQPLLYIS